MFLLLFVVLPLLASCYSGMRFTNQVGYQCGGLGVGAEGGEVLSIPNRVEVTMLSEESAISLRVDPGGFALIVRQRRSVRPLGTAHPYPALFVAQGERISVEPYDLILLLGLPDWPRGIDLAEYRLQRSSIARLPISIAALQDLMEAVEEGDLLACLEGFILQWAWGGVSMLAAVVGLGSSLDLLSTEVIQCPRGLILVNYHGPCFPVAHVWG